MACKTLSEALDKAMLVGPLGGMKDRIANELRDYMAHRAMQYARLSDEEYSAVMKFFNEIFKDVPAFTKE